MCKQVEIFNEEKFNTLSERRESLMLFCQEQEDIIAELIEQLVETVNMFESNLEKLEYATFNRDVDEIYLELKQMVDKLWYERHQYHKAMIERGEETCDPIVWDDALKSAEEVEQKYGTDFVCKDDFEWGMLNGKISALRWVFGDEWDNLDT